MNQRTDREKLDSIVEKSKTGKLFPIVVSIGAVDFCFKGKVVWDSLKNPPHRIEAFEEPYTGTVVFINLKEE